MLRVVSHRWFVGRGRELERLSSLLSAEGPVVHVLYAPGGMGKTTLGRAFERRAVEHEHATAWADASIVDPTPEAIVELWRATLGVRALADLETPTILFLDGFERMHGEEYWLRERLPAVLGPRTRLVLMGRTPPSPRWTTAPEWIGRIDVTRLTCWEPPDAAAFLEAHGIDVPLRAPAIAAAHGHPLALALLVDVHRSDGGSMTLADHPSLVAYLVERLCGTIVEPLEREALSVAAAARVTTQSLLEAMLGLDDGYPLFQWMRRLSFVQVLPQGLAPHELVRDLLHHELAWRDPERVRRLEDRFHEHYLARFEEVDDPRLELEVLRDIAFLRRHHPMIRDAFSFQPDHALYLEPATEADAAEIEVMLRRHQLGGGMRWVDYWRGHPSATLGLVRDERGAAVGVELVLRVDDAILAQAEADGVDPAAGALRSSLARRGGPRAGEHAVVGRLWCTSEGQTANQVQSQLWLARVRECIRDPSISHLVAYFARPDAWQLAFTYMGFERAPEADAVDEAWSDGAFIRDWRTEPAARWCIRMATAGPGRIRSDAPRLPAPAVVLSEASFAEAVKQALQAYPSRDALARNPLARSRLIMQRHKGPPTTPPDHAEQLAELLEEACDSVRLDRGMRKAYRALHRSFVNPAPTQREAAELTGMPFSTFRRQLTRGIELVTHYLWRLESNDAG